MQSGNSRMEKGKNLQSKVRELPQKQSNFFYYPYFYKDYYVHTIIANKGIQGIEDIVCELQGKMAKLDTIKFGNGQSVHDIFS